MAMAAPIGASAQTSPPASGIDLADIDRAVRPQDDFYGFAVGNWVRNVQPPSYMPGWSAGRELQLQVYRSLESDLRNLAADPETDDDRRMADLYASYMDEAQIETRGLAPLSEGFARLDAMTDAEDVARELGRLSKQGLDVGLGIWVHADDQEPTRYIADFVQVGLSLPTRDHYLGEEPRLAGIRAAYRDHVERVLALTGLEDPSALAGAIVDLEIQLTRAQWTEVATRVPGATSHRVSRDQLSGAAPGLDLAIYAEAAGVPIDTQRFNVSQPDYFIAYGDLIERTPVAVWRAYLRYRLTEQYARLLSKPFRDEADAFYSRTLNGATTSRPRWLRAVGFVEDSMGDALGQVYIREHLSDEAEARARRILDDVVAAFRARIESSDWMSPASKAGALAKLDNLVIRMGGPDGIRDYGRLTTSPTDLVGNAIRVQTLRWAFEVDKLARPVDREEWTMSAQSVNGSYSVSRNQVVLPAALLQPPYFQAEADGAANHGGLGWFIAHELSHAFDRAGSQYDGFGRRVEWMEPDDRAEFERRAQALIAQYGAYELAPGARLNGELSIGENIADVSGLAIAHEAYVRSLGGREAPVIDGLTGEQRFFLGFARIWAAEPVKEADITQALADTHTPARFRVIGSVSNLDAFYAAFDVEPGDPMYLPPEARTQIW
jgi:predicted metalloendopeptidase